MDKCLSIVKRVLVMLLLSIPQTALAQTFPIFDGTSGIGIVDQDALFAQSNAGKAYISTFEISGKNLASENLLIQESLEEEERELTQKRKTLESDVFEKLAFEFDQKVKQIRTEQSAKERNLNLQLTRNRSTFYEDITPILLKLLDERRIEVLLNKKSVVLALRGSDITQVAIQRINEVLK
jgi:Skp family chaperone for outer membrane proteins